eukprot:gene17544-23107_t
MTVRKSLSTVDEEINNYWIFLDSWTVDMNGIVDVEIDKEAEIDFESIGYDPNAFEIVIPPGNWIPFGWIDPESSQRINLVVGKHLYLSTNRYIVKINPSDNGEIMRLSDHTGRLGTAGEMQYNSKNFSI